MLKLLQGEGAGAASDVEPAPVGFDELCQLAAQDMIAVALLKERPDYLDAHADVLDASGLRMVVGNGFARSRMVTTGSGMIEVKAPRVDDRREGEKFVSAILPAYMRKSAKVTEVLPILYLRGLSTRDFAPALTHATDRFDSPVQSVRSPPAKEENKRSTRDQHDATVKRSDGGHPVGIASYGDQSIAPLIESSPSPLGCCNDTHDIGPVGVSPEHHHTATEGPDSGHLDISVTNAS